MIQQQRRKRHRRRGFSLLELIFVLAIGTVVLGTVGLCFSIVHRSYDHVITDVSDHRSVQELASRLRRDAHQSTGPAKQEPTDSQTIRWETAAGRIRYTLGDEVIERHVDIDDKPHIEHWPIDRQPDASWQLSEDRRLVTLKISIHGKSIELVAGFLASEATQ